MRLKYFELIFIKNDQFFYQKKKSTKKKIKKVLKILKSTKKY